MARITRIEDDMWVIEDPELPFYLAIGEGAEDLPPGTVVNGHQITPIGRVYSPID